MIRVPVKTKKGVYRVMRTRVPRTRTFELYRRAQEEAPELLKQIYAVISRDVEARATDEVHRSTVLMSGIPSDRPFQKRWVDFSDSEVERRSLFEQVLWTYFFDRQETWETTWPDKGRIGAEYVREVVKPSEAREPGLRPKGAKGVAPKAASRGIGPAPTGQPGEEHEERVRHVSPRTTRDDSAAIAELPTEAAGLVLNQCVLWKTTKTYGRIVCPSRLDPEDDQFDSTMREICLTYGRTERPEGDMDRQRKTASRGPGQLQRRGTG